MTGDGLLRGGVNAVRRLGDTVDLYTADVHYIGANREEITAAFAAG